MRQTRYPTFPERCAIRLRLLPCPSRHLPVAEGAVICRRVPGSKEDGPPGRPGATARRPPDVDARSYDCPFDKHAQWSVLEDACEASLPPDCGMDYLNRIPARSPHQAL